MSTDRQLRTRSLVQDIKSKKSSASAGMRWRTQNAKSLVASFRALVQSVTVHPMRKVVNRRALVTLRHQSNQILATPIGVGTPRRNTVFPDNGHLPNSWDGSAPAYPGGRDIGKLPPVGAALNRSRSRVRGSWRVVSCALIAPRRSNIAHLRRPWRATLRQSTPQYSSRPNCQVGAGLEGSSAA